MSEDEGCEFNDEIKKTADFCVLSSPTGRRFTFGCRYFSCRTTPTTFSVNSDSLSLNDDSTAQQNSQVTIINLKFKNMSDIS
jgi:hypothetical protein